MLTRRFAPLNNWRQTNTAHAVMIAILLLVSMGIGAATANYRSATLSGVVTQPQTAIENQNAEEGAMVTNVPGIGASVMELEREKLEMRQAQGQRAGTTIAGTVQDSEEWRQQEIEYRASLRASTLPITSGEDPAAQTYQGLKDRQIDLLER